MTSQSGDMLVWLTIFGAAGVTYSLRIGGLLLAERLPMTGRFKRFMDALRRLVAAVETVVDRQ